jgi:hypothetical protein
MVFQKYLGREACDGESMSPAPGLGDSLAGLPAQVFLKNHIFTVIKNRMLIMLILSAIPR